MSQRHKPRQAETTSGRARRPSAPPADVLSQIVPGKYDSYRSFMDLYDDEVDSSLLEKVLQKAITFRSNRRDDLMRQCLHNIALIQCCINAGDHWPDFIEDLEDGRTKAKADLANSLRMFESRLQRQRLLSDPTAAADTSILPRLRAESLVIRAKEEQPETYTRSEMSKPGGQRHMSGNTADAEANKPEVQRHMSSSTTASEARRNMFIPAKDIHPDLIDAWARKHCGRDAVVKPTEHEGKKGYLLTASQTPTRDHLSILIKDSKNLSKRTEKEGGRHDSTATQKTTAVTPGQQTPHDRSGLVEITARRQSSPPGRGRTSRFDASSRRRDWPESEMDILTKLTIISEDYDDPCPISWAELDHGTHGKIDNLMSRDCFHAMSGDVDPVGQRMQTEYRKGDTRYGVLVWLNLKWPGGGAKDVPFVVEDNDEHTYGVVLGKTIIDKHDLLNCEAKSKMSFNDKGVAHVQVRSRKVTAAKNPIPVPPIDRTGKPREGTGAAKYPEPGDPPLDRHGKPPPGGPATRR